MEPSFYLTGTRFTEVDENCIGIANQITGENPIDEINEYVRSLPCGSSEKKVKKLRRRRTAGQIIKDRFVTGCTDSGLVFITLARIKGIPAAYVETIEEDYLRRPEGTISGHIFVDIYQDSEWTSYNPGHGRTERHGENYFWEPNQLSPVYVEVARGLDFSQLYREGIKGPIDLSSIEKLSNFIRRI